jgi:hypothetical protein
VFIVNYWLIIVPISHVSTEVSVARYLSITHVNVQTNLRIREYVSKSVGFIAIIFLCTSAGYIISLDILTYVFNIDLTAKDRDQIRRKRALCKKGIRKSPRKTICRRRKNKIASLPQPKKTNRTTLNIIK